MTKPIIIEEHPFPFFPSNKAKWLFIGTFPPEKRRWAIEFFYPNFYGNDMWNIFGKIFFQDKNHFVDILKNTTKEKTKEAIEELLRKEHIAMHNVAKKIVRLKGNASDKNLGIKEWINIEETIRELPDLQYIVATGGRALKEIVGLLSKGEVGKIKSPKIGEYVSFTFENRDLRLYRMPSTSKNYTLALDKKVGAYKKMFDEV